MEEEAAGEEGEAPPTKPETKEPETTTPSTEPSGESLKEAIENLPPKTSPNDFEPGMGWRSIDENPDEFMAQTNEDGVPIENDGGPRSRRDLIRRSVESWRAGFR